MMVQWKARQLGDGKQLFNFTLPLTRSLHTPSLCLHSPLCCQHLRLHRCPNLMPPLFPAEYTTVPFRQTPLRCFHTHRGAMQTCAHTYTLSYRLFWPRPLGWVNISIIYHDSPTAHRAAPAGDRASCRQNNNSDKFSLLGSAFFY